MAIPVYPIEKFNCSNTLEIKDFEIHRLEDLLRSLDGVVFPHRHAFYNILYITQGQGTHAIDFQDYEVHPERLFFVSDGQVHAWDLSPDTQGFSLFFRGDFIEPYCEDSLYDFPFFHSAYRLPLLQLESIPFQSEIQHLFQHLYIENSNPSKYRLKILRSFLYILLVKLNEHYEQKAGQKLRPTSEVFRKYERMVSDYFLEKRAVAEYADSLNVTSNYLNTLTNKAVGKTAKAIINDRLMTEAKRLLINSERTVSEIAYALNFKDTSYFSRFFKKQEGLSAEEFRRKKTDLFEKYT